jgi:hypothetical protein
VDGDGALEVRDLAQLERAAHRALRVVLVADRGPEDEDVLRRLIGHVHLAQVTAVGSDAAHDLRDVIL